MAAAAATVTAASASRGDGKRLSSAFLIKVRSRLLPDRSQGRLEIQSKKRKTQKPLTTYRGCWSQLHQQLALQLAQLQPALQRAQLPLHAQLTLPL
jgi:hypothetical protein